MKIDNFINKLFHFIFGFYRIQDGHTKVFYDEPRAHFHSQNLNEDKRGHVKGWPWHGRAYVSWKGHALFRWDWSLWSSSFGFSIRTDSEDGGMMFSFSIPPVSLWLVLPIPFQKVFLERPFWARWNESTGGYKGSNRYTSFHIAEIRVFDWTIWWNFLKFDWGWSRQMPKWMDGNFHLADFFIGKSKYSKEILETHEVSIPMPEGSYPATVTIERCTWKRPRWFAKVREGATIDIPWGIPHEGKGENAWDCGEDRLLGCGSNSTKLSEIIGDVVRAGLRGREKYNGKGVKAVYPTPVAPIPRPPEPEGEQAKAG